MIRKILLFLFLLGFFTNLIAQDSLVVYTKRGFSGDRPKIGLVLSGGGAKGIAHVSFLRVMEEAGIRPDYISGTSMGSIVGALYAIGFSIDSIESMIYSENWTDVLSNQIDYQSVNMEEKKGYGEYFAELPFYGWNPGLPSGAIKGQGLELLFERLTISVAGDTSFDDFFIPYRAVATDLLTGKAYVFSGGSLAFAMRSSMSIPTIMQPVKYKGMLLVDGGLVENFPVRVVKDMGADIIIGVYTGGQLLPEEDLTSMVAILKQSSLMGGILDAHKQKKDVDIYVEPYLNDMSAADFNSGYEFYNRGYSAAKEKLPELLELANYMKQFDVEIKDRPELKDSVYITEIDFSEMGDDKYQSLISRMLVSKRNKWVRASDLEEKVGYLYGTRLFRKVGFHFTAADSTEGVKLVYDIEERETKFLNIGFHYRNESKIGLLVNTTFRNVLSPMSKLELKLRLSEYPAFRVRYFNYLGYSTKFATSLSYNLYVNNIPFYTGNELSAQYVRYKSYVKGDLSFFPNIYSSLSISARFESNNYKKQIDNENPYYSNIKSRSWFANFEYQINTLDAKYFSSKGMYLRFRTEVNMNSEEDYYLNKDTLLIYPGFENPFNISILPYLQSSLDINLYQKLANRWVLSHEFFTVLSTNNTSILLNSFLIGGVNTSDPNQLPFWGLYENSDFVNNGSYYRIGLRYRFLKNIFLTTKFNGLFVADDIKDIFNSKPSGEDSYIGNWNNYILGWGLELSYRSLLGPISVTVTKNDRYEGVWSHVRVGFVF